MVFLDLYAKISPLSPSIPDFINTLCVSHIIHPIRPLPSSCFPASFPVISYRQRRQSRHTLSINQYEPITDSIPIAFAP